MPADRKLTAKRIGVTARGRKVLTDLEIAYPMNLPALIAAGMLPIPLDESPSLRTAKRRASDAEAIHQ